MRRRGISRTKRLARAQQAPARPTAANTKAEILEWLEAHGVEASMSMNKDELLEKVAHA